MALENGSPSIADIAAITGRNGMGFGGDGGGWTGLLFILFLFAMCNGGWQNGGGNANTQAEVQRGFDHQATSGALAGLQAQIGNGLSDAAVARCNAETTLLQALNNNQTATTAAMNDIERALQQCCCDNRAAVADLKYTVATEACADRATVSNGVRDILEANTRNTQALLDGQRQGFQAIQDKLCQLELDSFKQKVNDLAAENAALRGAASQTAQTAMLQAGNAAQTQQILEAIRNLTACGCGNNCGCGAA